MVKRIVKLTFREDTVEEFLEKVFTYHEPKLRAFPGCLHLELLRDTDRPYIIFTLSHWTDEAALEVYRHSELFKDTWSKTKPLFGEKAEAWTLRLRE